NQIVMIIQTKAILVLTMQLLAIKIKLLNLIKITKVIKRHRTGKMINHNKIIKLRIKITIRQPRSNDLKPTTINKTTNLQKKHKHIKKDKPNKNIELRKQGIIQQTHVKLLTAKTINKTTKLQTTIQDNKHIL